MYESEAVAFHASNGRLLRTESFLERMGAGGRGEGKREETSLSYICAASAFGEWCEERRERR